MDALKLKPEGTTAVIQGFGNVGSVAAGTMARSGTSIIAVSDVSGGVYNQNGLDLNAIDDHLAKHRTLAGFPGGEPISQEDLLVLPCDILVPAALERQITEKNAGQLKCRILAEGANGPVTPEADAILEQRPDIFVIPDILCNAGGVVVSYFEWVQDLQSFFWDEAEIMGKLYRILETAFRQTVNTARDRNVSMRTAALSLGIQRVYEAKKKRGLYP
jgi:glutamate dehydrogenase (NAD(P)+)